MVKAIMIITDYIGCGVVEVGKLGVVIHQACWEQDKGLGMLLEGVAHFDFGESDVLP